MKKSGQLPLDLVLEPDYRAEAFEVTESNAAALALVDRWPRWRQGHLLLVGPAGSGKTHLSHMWAARACPLRPGAGMLSRALDQVERGVAVLVEDCDHGVDEDALFHLLNRAANDAKVTVLMTAGKALESWPIHLPDLASRLHASETAVLHEPDDALLRQVMEKLFRDRRMLVSPGVIEYLLDRMERSVDYARNLVAWLDREALVRKKPVTRTLAREGLEILST